MSQEAEREPIPFDALGNPMRRKIIEEIAAQEKLSYKQLIRVTNLKSGPLYHHLHKLENLITQDEEKKYLLTEQGLRVYKLIKEGTIEELEECEEIKQAQEEKDHRILSFLGISLRPIIAFFAKHPYRTIAEFLVLAIICGYLSYRDDILLIGNFTLNIETQIYFSYLGLIGSWLFIGGLAELGARFLFKKKEGSIALIGATGLAFLPIFIFSIVIFIVNLAIQTELYMSSILLLALHGVFQVWTFLVLSTALGVTKKLSLEKSIILSLIINYVQIMIVIFILIP